MLSIGRLAGPDSERYYLSKVAQGREDYYSGRGEAPGRWAGSAIDLVIETDGEVSGEDFKALLAGRSPGTGEQLGSPVARSVAGFDLTFQAPKSVSILYGIGDERSAGSVREAHDRAVHEALGYLEREACWTRRGRGGREHVRGNGFAAAAFRHRTSRAGDPTLHTHVVVANVTRGPDGRWSALDSRQLYRQAKTAGYLYQAALRHQLTGSLGVAWQPVVNGTSDIVGVPRVVVEHFSQRRRAILEHMAARGERSARAAQIAALDTRQRKQDGMPIDGLRADWRARAEEHGLTPAKLADVLDRGERFPADRLDEARLGVDTVLPELTEQASTFDRRHVLQAWAQRHRTGAPTDALERVADAWLASSRATPVEPDRRPHLSRRYSTPEMLALEAELVEHARARQGTGAGQVEPATLHTVLDRRGELSDEQADMVRSLTSSGDGMQVVRAAAGTGKTYALDAARQAWQAEGRHVLGCALSARAAVELHEQTGIETMTIARLRLDLEHGHALAPGSVLIVDEAGMVGTRTISELAKHAQHADAKLVLCGDDRQLPEIAAGGALRGLARRLGAIELREIRRQRHDWDRHALTALREGRVEDWASVYREHDRIIAAPDAISARAQLVADWHRATVDHPGEDVVMIAHRRSDVAELNQRARVRLHAAGQLSTTELETGDRAFALGDRVVTCRNDQTLAVTNGMRGTITTLDPERGVVAVTFDDGSQTMLSPGYVQDGHLDHAYAMTAHRAQGATVDRTFVLGSEDLYREWGYTALSRHREQARFYVNLGNDAQPQLPGLEITADPLHDPVLTPLRRQRAKQLALDAAQANRMPTPAELQELLPDLNEIRPLPLLANGREPDLDSGWDLGP